MQHNPKIILTDCDGVLLDWTHTFREWMSARGLVQKPDAEEYYSVHDQFGIDSTTAKKYTRLFNESAAIGFLPPFRDAVQWVQRLHHEHQYKFVVITSLSKDPFAQQLRKHNLVTVFGDIFEHIECLDTGSDKAQALAPYQDSGLWWIEDKPANAQVGQALGLRSVLIEHGHNTDHDHALILHAANWQDIYRMVIDQLP